MDRRSIESRASLLTRGPWPYVLLLVLSLSVRLPLLGNFAMVSYDGTYYIRQAREFFSAPHVGAAFPIGYPLFIASLLPLFGDGVMAAAAVSLLAALGTVIITYLLIRRRTGAGAALLGAALVSTNPLFLKYSLLTMSESLYLFWITLAFYLFSRRRHAGAGLAVGVAAAVRPEGIATVPALALLSKSRPLGAIALTGAFLAIYALNIYGIHKTTGRVKLLAKVEALGYDEWKGREQEFSLELKKKMESGQFIRQRRNYRQIALHYLPKIGSQVGMLVRHLLPFVFLLGIYGCYRRPDFLLASFLQFFLLPLFALRDEPRFVLPYLPFLVVFGLVGAESMPTAKMKRLAYLGLFVTLPAAPLLNSDQFLTPLPDAFPEFKICSQNVRQMISGRKVADRKPYLAFYADADFVRIPNDPYEVTIEYLLAQGVDYLSLHPVSVKAFRPALSPLLYDPAAIMGELRFRQAYFLGENENRAILLYRRVRDDDPLRWRKLTKGGKGNDRSPCWSPDGSLIAFSSTRGGIADIYAVASGGGQARILVGTEGNDDFPRFSSDGRMLAFCSDRAGNWDIYLYRIDEDTVIVLADTAADEYAPCWIDGDRALLFSTGPPGRSRIAKIDIASGQVSLFQAAGSHPATGPGGRLAWIRQGRTLVVTNDRDTTEIRSPKHVYYAPAWSPDGRFLAITGTDWGSPDLYLLDETGRRVLLLTKNPGVEKQPAWSPQGDKIALVSDQGGSEEIWIVTGLEAYRARLTSPPRFVYLRQ